MVEIAYDLHADRIPESAVDRTGVAGSRMDTDVFERAKQPYTVRRHKEVRRRCPAFAGIETLERLHRAQTHPLRRSGPPGMMQHDTRRRYRAEVVSGDVCEPLGDRENAADHRRHAGRRVVAGHALLLAAGGAAVWRVEDQPATDPSTASRRSQALSKDKRQATRDTNLLSPV